MDAAPVRYFLQHAYHGLHFHGWQRQPDTRSVQGELERVLALLLRHPVALVGAGRTDAGVHAEASFTHFDTAAALPPDFLYRLNAMLPHDLAAHRLYRCLDAGLHARFSAISRSYTYTLTRVKAPMLHDRSWFFPYPLDVDALQAAADLLKRQTDFASFAKRGGTQHTTRCTVFESRWEQAGSVLRYHVTANRFLRGMVRALVGTQVEVGQGKLPLAALQAVVDAHDRRKAGANVPPQGLALVGVAYPMKNLQLVQFL